MPEALKIINLGAMGYEAAYEAQLAAHGRVLEARAGGFPGVGELLLVEHDPVVTISNRAGAAANLLATPELLARSGVAVARTDRGGDITYHGPGQLVAYPILDLNLLNLGLHDYMRLLEEVVILVCRHFGIETMRDATATGVWTIRDGRPHAKIGAMGVRVRKWVSMHGLALNVTTNLDHFRLIVPCGLVGRPVTNLSEQLGRACPTMDEVERVLVREFEKLVGEQMEKARRDRAAVKS